MPPEVAEAIPEIVYEAEEFAEIDEEEAVPETAAKRETETDTEAETDTETAADLNDKTGLPSDEAALYTPPRRMWPCTCICTAIFHQIL